MSSASSIHSTKNLVQAVWRFRYADFFIKSTPAIGLAFIVFVLLKGWIW